MYSKSLLVGALIYEAKKRDGIYMLHAAWDATEAGLLAFADKWDEFYPETEQSCDVSIMCLREGKRHKAGCPMNSNYSETCPKDKHFSCNRVHGSTN